MKSAFEKLYRALTGKRAATPGQITAACALGNVTVTAVPSDEGLNLVVSGVDVRNLQVGKKRVGAGPHAQLHIQITRS